MPYKVKLGQIDLTESRPSEEIALKKEKPTINVITATFNAQATVGDLISSLELQTDKDFQWIIADGGSTDGTLDAIRNKTKLNYTISSEEDFGIYDALNRAIKRSDAEYYVVVGADDRLYPDAISNFRKHANGNPDIIAAQININGKIIKPNKGRKSLYGAMAYVAGHAVGTCIRKDLHMRFGYYSRLFPIAADQFFILKSVANNATLRPAMFTAGEFSTDGLSGKNYLGTATEFFRIQLLTGSNKYIQTIIFILRLLKNISRI